MAKRKPRSRTGARKASASRTGAKGPRRSSKSRRAKPARARGSRASATGRAKTARGPRTTARTTSQKSKRAAKPKATKPKSAKPKTAMKAKTAASPARARSARPVRPKPTALDRARRVLPEQVMVPSPPSSLNFESKATSARTGRAELAQLRRNHSEAGPALTGGDVDARWEEAYASGDEAPGGDNPTPDQDIVEEIGHALGVEYDDAEELKGADKLQERDRHRWELDPASADDYRDRFKKT